ncbi:MAG: DUF1353 domain-containing protein [Verrucomicrobiales bacterium]|nr:DUF1353 domain-containing protein [Verrucomicrobiales bacterium]
MAKLASLAVRPIAGDTTLKRLEELRMERKLGYFTGEPRLIPIASNLFWFYQPLDPKEQFAFVSYMHDPDCECAGKCDVRQRKPWKIVPQSMIFDGASVPRVAWNVKSFGPFDFTKSALIHDWLFEAHHRAQIAQYGYNISAFEGGEHGTEAQLRELESAFRKVEQYIEKDEMKTDCNRLRSRAKKGLEMEDAAWIMAEAIYREMLTSEVLMELTEATIDHEKQEMNEEERVFASTVRGLTKQVEPALSISRPRRHVLGVYRYAVDSIFCRNGAWEPKSRRGARKEESPHASSIATLEALKRTALREPERFKELRNEKVITPELLMLLGLRETKSLPEKAVEHTVSQDVVESAKELQAQQEMLRIVREISTLARDAAASQPLE